MTSCHDVLSYRPQMYKNLKSDGRDWLDLSQEEPEEASVVCLSANEIIYDQRRVDREK